MFPPPALRGKRERVLPPVRPNVGIELAYRRRFDALLTEMHRSLTYWLRAVYRANPPKMAADDSPAMELRGTFRRLARRWTRRFDDLAGDLGRYFATTTAERSTAALQSMLRRGGLSVLFRTTRAVNDITMASVGENVALIKSIGQQYLSSVEQLVMRSVQEGRALDDLAEALEHQFGVTRRRAALISRDQNNKLTAVVQRARQQELGITTAIWIHSGGGKHPRPSHVKAGRDRTRFKVAEGWWDPAIKRFIWPGTEINCRCVSRPVIEGFK